MSALMALDSVGCAVYTLWSERDDDNGDLTTRKSKKTKIDPIPWLSFVSFWENSRQKFRRPVHGWRNHPINLAWSGAQPEIC